MDGRGVGLVVEPACALAKPGGVELIAPSTGMAATRRANVARRARPRIPQLRLGIGVSPSVPALVAHVTPPLRCLSYAELPEIERLGYGGALD